MIELGRYFVGEAGLYVTRIVGRKISCGQVFLVTDGGLNHHLAASGNFGQVVRKNYPVTVVTSARSTEREVASVVGPLCTPLDLLAVRAGGYLGFQVNLEGRLVHLGVIGPSLRRDQVNRMRRIVGARGSVLAGAVSAVANHSLNGDADVFFDPLNGR